MTEAEGTAVRWRALTLEVIVFALLVCALVLTFLEPPISSLTSVLPGDLGDPVLNLYFMEWGSYRLSHGLEGFWDANFFYPNRGVMALSDHMIGPSVFKWTLEHLVAGTVSGTRGALAYNLLFLGSFVGCAVVAFGVARAQRSSRAAALVVGLAFAFNPYRYSQIPHLQVLLSVLVPLLLWLFYRLITTPNWKTALAFLLAYGVHLSGGTYLAYMIHLAFLIMVISASRRLTRDLASKRSFRLILGVTFLLCAATFAAVFLPYVTRSDELGLDRHPSEIRFYGTTFVSLLQVDSTRSHWFPRLFHQRAENSLFPGFSVGLLLLVGAAGLFSLRPARAAPDRTNLRSTIWERVAWLCAIGSLLFGDLLTWGALDGTTLLGRQATEALGLGAFVLFLVGLVAGMLLCRRRTGHWLPIHLEAEGFTGHVVRVGIGLALLSLPVIYVMAMEMIPGLDGMRVTTRLWSVVTFAIAWIAGCGVEFVGRHLERSEARPAGLALAASLAIVFLLENQVTVAWPKLRARSEFPAIYQRIAGDPRVEATAEFPRIADATEAMTMLYSTLHWKPIVNGFSSRSPPLTDALLPPMELPDAATVSRLRAAGVTHVLVHRGQVLRRGVRRGAFKAWQQSAFAMGLNQVAESGNDRLYEIVK